MPIPSATYPFDPTGVAGTNLITAERQIIPAANSKGFVLMIPFAAPYYRSSLTVTYVPNGRVLVEGVDYYCTHYFYEATTSIGQPIYGSVTLLDNTLAGSVDFTYQTIGGEWTIDSNTIQEILTNTMLDPRIATWEQIVDLPFQFPPSDHQHDVNTDGTNVGDVVEAIYDVAQAVRDQNSGVNQTHLDDHNNPHEVTAAQVGLGNVVNGRMATNQEAIDGAATNLYINPANLSAVLTYGLGSSFASHIADTSNPHQVSKLQIGLGNVPNYTMATVIETKQGTLSDRFVNPVGAAALVDERLGFHTADIANPHETTAAQVGLGNVPNYAAATQLQAQAGLSDSSLMTPAMTKVFVDSYIGDTLSGHIADDENPHYVTKAQVGLSQVVNLPIASLPDTLAGVADTGYITPRLLGAALTNWGGGGGGGDGGALAAHLADLENPHQVTAAQVGAYTRAEVDDLVEGLGGGGGGGGNADMLNGLTSEQLIAAASGRGYWPNVEANEIDDGFGGYIDVFDGKTATGLCTFSKVDEFSPSSFVALLSGGASEDENSAPVFLLSYEGNAASLKAKLIQGFSETTKFYTEEAWDGSSFTLYSYNGPLREAMSFVLLTSANLTFAVGSSESVIDMKNQESPPANNLAKMSYDVFDPIRDNFPGDVIVGAGTRGNYKTLEPKPMLLEYNVVQSGDTGAITAAQSYAYPLSESSANWRALSADVTRNRDVSEDSWQWQVWTDGKFHCDYSKKPQLDSYCSEYACSEYQITADLVVESSGSPVSDSSVGICIAHRRLNGHDYGVYLMRQVNGRLLIAMNPYQSDEVILDEQSLTSIQTYDGVANKCTVHIEKSYTSVTVYCTEWGDDDWTLATPISVTIPDVLDNFSNTYYGVAKYNLRHAVVNLTDYPNKYYPYIAMGVGYEGKYSYTMNTYRGASGWTSRGLSQSNDDLPFGRFVFSPMTGINYFVRRDGSLRKLPTVPFNADGTPYSP